MIKLSSSDLTLFPHGNGVRKLINVDGEKLRLFFLSLLWRAAATDLFEFANIRLTPESLERLRNMVANGIATPYEFFPVTLIQLTTRFLPHNYTPTRDVKHEPIIDALSLKPTEDVREIDHYRFYFDGLICHFHIDADENHIKAQSGIFVGPGNELYVTAISGAGSRQQGLLMESFRQFDLSNLNSPAKI